MQGFEVEKIGSTLVLSCPSQVTFESVGTMRQVVEHAISTDDFTTLVVDLSGVTFMDSSGIGTLVALNSKVYSAEKKFYLLAPTEQVKKTLDLVRLSDFFEFLDTREEFDLVEIG